ncbi:hypothetical protein J4573_20130 [Actinomadura barringtoniae]|uniref:Uncharacterized protein n=1 Tax=Actinomadura barringtoniae TaxID=1427535 RepID=A0A939T2C8_9ACTN|nr:hypothetical protein [Actinomadura barringtoniae]MBO2449421.1 hypothetical protein [Actinomadura barringtoniae]
MQITRLVRGGFLAAVCTLLALAGHALGGACCLPPISAVLATGAVVGLLCVALASRMLSFWKILVVVGWAQVAFHVAFTMAAPGPAGAHHMSAAPVPSPGVRSGMGLSMLAGHAAAAVAAALLLAGAERALWWLLGAVFAIAFTRLVLRPVEIHRPPWAVIVADDAPPRLGVLLARAVRRRGPPMERLHAV